MLCSYNRNSSHTAYTEMVLASLLTRARLMPHTSSGPGSTGCWSRPIKLMNFSTDLSDLQSNINCITHFNLHILTVSVYSLTSHSTHNRSFQGRIFPANGTDKQTYNAEDKLNKPKDNQKKPHKLNLTKPN